MKTKTPKLTQAEIDYLYWFRINADFGPADGDVKNIMDEDYEAETGNKVPKGWRDGD